MVLAPQRAYHQYGTGNEQRHGQHGDRRQSAATVALRLNHQLGIPVYS